MQHVRDSQRVKLYRADDVLRQYATPLPSVADVELFVKRVWRSGRFRKAYPAAVTGYSKWTDEWLPTVHDGRGRRNAGGDHTGIWIPTWARKTDVVIHELAHVVAERVYGAKQPIAGHGWEFCSVYLKLVLWFMGREAHDALKASFKEHRVRWKPKAKRVITPEARERLRAAAELARAAKQRKTVISD